jgi:hypothetical protein
MASKLATLGGAALALLLASSFPNSADARFGGGGFRMGGMHMGGMHMGGMHWGGMRMGGMHMGGPRFFHGGPRFHSSPRFFHSSPRFFHSRFHNRPFFFHRARFAHRFPFHHRRFHRNVFFFGAFPVYADYGYGYNNGYGCYWLRRNALYTGSPYWWSRYRSCVYGYGY